MEVEGGEVVVAGKPIQRTALCGSKFSPKGLRRILKKENLHRVSCLRCRRLFLLRTERELLS